MKTGMCSGCGVSVYEGEQNPCESCSGWLKFETVDFRISKERDMLGVQGDSVELWWWDSRVCWDQGIQLDFDSYQKAIKFVLLLQEKWQEYNEAMNKTIDQGLDFDDEGAINDWIYDRLEEVEK